MCNFQPLFQTVKVGPNGQVLKTRLVAKGYAQIFRLDYNGTFSSMAKITNFLSMAVKNTFLHGDFEEDVCIEQPLGFVVPGVYYPSMPIVPIILWSEIVSLSLFREARHSNSSVWHNS